MWHDETNWHFRCGSASSLMRNNKLEFDGDKDTDVSMTVSISEARCLTCSKGPCGSFISISSSDVPFCVSKDLSFLKTLSAEWGQTDSRVSAQPHCGSSCSIYPPPPFPVWSGDWDGRRLSAGHYGSSIWIAVSGAEGYRKRTKTDNLKTEGQHCGRGHDKDWKKEFNINYMAFNCSLFPQTCNNALNRCLFMICNQKSVFISYKKVYLIWLSLIVSGVILLWFGCLL